LEGGKYTQNYLRNSLRYLPLDEIFLSLLKYTATQFMSLYEPSTKEIKFNEEFLA